MKSIAFVYTQFREQLRMCRPYSYGDLVHVDIRERVKPFYSSERETFNVDKRIFRRIVLLLSFT